MSCPDEGPSPVPEPSTFSAETFFATQDPPPKLPSILEGVAQFVKKHASEGRKIVLVTVC